MDALRANNTTTSSPPSSISIEYILECLKGLLIPTHTKECEDRLKQIELHHGYGLMLAEIAMNKLIQQDIRQLSLLLLKNKIKAHWSSTPETEPSDEEKAKIKDIITPGLSDPISKIRTAIAMCIGKIGAIEWPEQWPSLLTNLIQCLDPNINKDKNLFSGSMKCLEILCNPKELEDSQIQHIIVVLYPVFITMLSSDYTDYTTQLKIINIFKSTVTHILSNQSHVRKVLEPVIPVWMEQFAKLLSRRVSGAEDKFINEQFTIQTGIIESLTYFISSYAKTMSQYMSTLIQPIWSIFVDYYPLYERSEIWVDGVIPVSTDEGVTRIDTLIAAIIEFIMHSITLKAHKKIFEAHLGAVIKQTLLYLQMTHELTELWQDEPSQFLEQEDESNYHPRVTSALLLQEISSQFKSKGLRLSWEAIFEQLSTAAKMGMKKGWRLREAALAALGTLTDDYIEAGDKKYFDFTVLLRDILSIDFNDSLDNDYTKILQSRSLTVASKFSGVVDPSLTLPYLRRTVDLLQSPSSSESIPLKLEALRALSHFSEGGGITLIKEYIPSILQSTCSLLNIVQDDCILLVIGTLKSLGRVDKDLTARFEPIITPALLHTWTKYSNDPELVEDIKEMFQILCSSTTVSVYPGILERSLPTFCTVLENFDKPLYVGIVESAVDIVSILIQGYKVDNVDPGIVSHIFRPMVDMMCCEKLQTDNGVLKAGMNAVTAIVHRTSSLLVNWVHPGNGQTAVACLLHIFEKQVSNNNEFIAMYAPPIAELMLVKMSDQIRPLLPALLSLVIKVLARAKVPSFKQSLVMIFARLFILHTNDVLDFLAKLELSNMLDANNTSIQNNNNNGLIFVMNEWLKHTEDIQTRLNVNISTIALARILASGDPRLHTIMVDGSMIIPKEFEGKTRMQITKLAVSSTIKWTKVSLIHKITKVLTDQYREEMETKREAEEANQKLNAKKLAKQAGIHLQGGEEEGSEGEEEDDDDFNVDDDFEDRDNYKDIDEFDYGDYDDDDDDDDFEDDYDPISKEDPLYNIDLINYIKELFVSLSTSNPTIFNEIQPILAKNFQA